MTVRQEGGHHVAYVRYRDYGGRLRRIKRLGSSKADASRRALAAVAESVAAGVGGDFTRSSKLAAGLEGWLAMFDGLVERGRRSPTTRDLYAGVTGRLIVPAIGGLRLGELTAPTLDRFLQAILREKGPATAKLCRAVLSGACGWLVRQGGLVTNPVRDLTPIELEGGRAAKALTMQEVRRWLAHLDADEFARRHDLPELARFMLATGLRVGEAVGVTWADVDLDAGVVMVQRTIVPVAGKGLLAKRVKSKASERGLIMPAWCVTLLRARRVRLGAFEGPVFPDSRGGWRDRGNVGKAFRRVRGDDFNWVTTHTFRKTVATLLDESGATARMIADQLGHSRVSMTQDVYLGRRAANAPNAVALEAYDPDAATPSS
ncbi:tyrosine-type recombinase/integrase [Auraticoccus monumenti]|uniref:tyrosine-type recombinase/integrase n=1 Tax=Auraticoccus monumenti TaxID=675864 RepID=UPI0018D314CC|nr:site-specific integrase [Auraticoccus monumenti]